MTGDDRVLVGRVGRPHGLDGAFFVEDASEDGRWFEVGARLLAAGGEVEVVAARRGAGGRPVIRLDRPAPRGAALEVPRDALPPTEEGEYYTFQLVGLEVVEEGGRASAGSSMSCPGSRTTRSSSTAGSCCRWSRRVCATSTSKLDVSLSLPASPTPTDSFAA